MPPRSRRSTTQADALLERVLQRQVAAAEDVRRRTARPTSSRATSRVRRRDLDQPDARGQPSDEERTRGLQVVLNYEGSGRMTFLLYNTHSLPVAARIRRPGEHPGSTSFGAQADRTLDRHAIGQRSTSPTRRCDFTRQRVAGVHHVDRHVLRRQPVAASCRRTRSRCEAVGCAVLLRDSRHVFFVTTERSRSGSPATSTDSACRSIPGIAGA